MPPRTTRKSYRPRVSDRTMVGTSPPRCLPAPETDERRHHNRMNPPRTRTPRASQHEMGWKAPRTFPLLPVAGEFFLLTFPFIERGYRQVAASTHLDGKRTNPALHRQRLVLNQGLPIL